MRALKKILIVEDDFDIGQLEMDFLEIEGYRVDLQTSGREGLKMALQEEYDLLIIDIMLPEMDGYEICKKVRAEKNIPILIVSAKKEDSDKIRGLGLGADDYIIKPFSPSELVARVKAHLARYEPLIGTEKQKTAEIRIRGLVIDETSRRTFVIEQEVGLTSKEFDLLLFMARHPNHVFSKEALFEKIWEFDSVGDINTVTVHIRKIRHKIEFDPTNPQ